MKLRNPGSSLENETQALIKHVQQARQTGDLRHAQTIFARLFTLLRRPVAHYLKSFTFLTDVQRDEVISDTFFRAFRAIDGYHPQPGSKFVSWLFAVARNAAYDQIDSYSREFPADAYVYLDDVVPDTNGHPKQTYSDVIANTDGTPEHSILFKEVSRYYEKALLELKPVDMLIIHWRMGERLSHREIATRLTDYQGKQYTEMCVRQRFHRTKKALRKKMNRYWVSPT